MVARLLIQVTFDSFFWQIVSASNHINDWDHPLPKVFHWSNELDHHSRGNER
jgi:hypothetical protein